MSTPDGPNGRPGALSRMAAESTNGLDKAS